MAHVSVNINGRHYRMACEDGQEEHLTKLGQYLDERITELRGKFGQIGDARLTVMAALTIADNLVEMNRKVRELEDQIAAMKDARVVSDDRLQVNNSAIADAFNAAADRIESIARKLNQTVAENSVAMG